MLILNTIGEQFAEEARRILTALGSVDYRTCSQDEFENSAHKYDIFFLGLGVNVTRSVIEKASHLKYIVTATTGLDHIDLVAAREHGVDVLSLRGEDAFLNTITGTAELAFGLLIDLARKTHRAFDDVKMGHWNRNAFEGVTLSGKTLGIVGMGRLGRIMARQARGFGMHVVYADLNKKDVVDASYENVSFIQLLENSDAISIHVHLTDETENMFSAEQFKHMKKSVFLINTSRGKIVDEAALLSALKSKQISGYGADVLADELTFKNNKFGNHPLVEYAQTHDNCIVVPHIGGVTVDSRTATDVFMAKKLRTHIVGKKETSTDV